MPVVHYSIFLEVITEDIREEAQWAMLLTDDLVLCDSNADIMEKKLRCGEDVWKKGSQIK